MLLKEQYIEANECEIESLTGDEMRFRLEKPCERHIRDSIFLCLNLYLKYGFLDSESANDPSTNKLLGKMEVGSHENKPQMNRESSKVF